jgi:hypothetical protein
MVVYSMIEITYKPFKELIIMEYTQYPKPEALAANLSITIQAGQPTALLWSEGVVFIPIPLTPETEIVAREYMNGRILWSSILFALLPIYQPTIKVGTLEVPVIDASPNHVMQQVSRWLKERLKGD